MLFTEVSPPANPVQTMANLLASAVRTGDEASNQWMDGIAWRSESCPTYQGFNPCTELEAPTEFGGDGLHYYVPVAYRVLDECSVMSGTFDTERVRRLTEAVASFAVARELWTGELSKLDPYDTPAGTDQVNGYLASESATVLGDVGDVWSAIAALEAAAGDAVRGQRVFIHGSVALIGLVSDKLERVGNELRTRTGAVVVADAGYPGTGPAVLGTSEVQTVTITGAPTGGDWTLTYDGETTAVIAWNAVGPTVAAALNALPNLAGVTVSGPVGGPYVVTFPAVDGAVVEMTADGTGLTGGVAPDVGVATTTPGVDPVPAQAGEWLYATGPIAVRLGAVATETEPASTVDRRTNTRSVWGSRMFAATFDRCAHFAIQVTGE